MNNAHEQQTISYQSKDSQPSALCLWFFLFNLWSCLFGNGHPFSWPPCCWIGAYSFLLCPGFFSCYVLRIGISKPLEGHCRLIVEIWETEEAAIWDELLCIKRGGVSLLHVWIEEVVSELSAISPIRSFCTGWCLGLFLSRMCIVDLGRWKVERK